MKPVERESLFALPDGTWLGLNVSRFDERQRRLRLRLPKTAGCWDYASVIDLVEREPGTDTYRFVGETVAERLRRMRQQNDPGLDGYIAWYESVITPFLAILARRPRNPDNHYCIEVSQLPLVAALPELLRASSAKSATVEHWSTEIRAMAANGVKKEEVDLCGVLSKLQQSPPGIKLSKSQVLRLVDLAHAMPKLVCEARFGFIPSAGWRECCERVPDRELKQRGLLGVGRGLAHVRFRHRSLGWSILRTRFRDLLSERREWWVPCDEKGRPVDKTRTGFDFVSEAMQFCELRMSQRLSRYGKDRFRPRWERFSLPGGDGYRELLLQLDDWPGTYRSRHYRTRNVLAHVRISERETNSGRKVLFLDEVQSDWHADLRTQTSGRDGVAGKTGTVEAPFAKEWPLLVMKVMLWWAQSRAAQGLAWSTPDLQQLRWRGYGPPEVLYRTTLPNAANALAKTLQLPLGTTRMRVRKETRAVVLGDAGWAVHDRGGRQITKPFLSRAQAERFADETGEFMSVEVPVLWLDGLPPIKGIPLFGCANAHAWLADVRSEMLVR